MGLKKARPGKPSGPKLRPKMGNKRSNGGLDLWVWRFGPQPYAAFPFDSPQRSGRTEQASTKRKRPDAARPGLQQFGPAGAGDLKGRPETTVETMQPTGENEQLRP